MKKEEANKIVLKLVAMFPNTEVSEVTIATWVEYLIPLEASVIRPAINEYILSPGKKFFPIPGEILEIYDRMYQEAMVKKTQADREAESEAIKLLFHEPLDKIDRSMGRIAKLSVALVRDVCDGKLKYKSPEWNIRQSEIEKLTSI